MTSATGTEATQRRAGTGLSLVLRGITLAALAVDAVVHVAIAGSYDANTGPWGISQGDLFLAEGVVAALVAVLLLVRPTRLAWAAAALVLAGGFAAVVLYTYVDVPAFGPLPPMYEPVWDVPGKLVSAYAEGLGALAALAGLGLARRPRR